MIDPLRPLGLNRPAIDPVKRPERTGRRDPDEEERRRREKGEQQGEDQRPPERQPGAPDDEGHLDVLA
jgi:hypothetical protein